MIMMGRPMDISKTTAAADAVVVEAVAAADAADAAVAVVI